MSYSKIQDFLNHADFTELPKINIRVLRNIMLETIEPYLRYLGYSAGLNIDVAFGKYDNILQEAIKKQSNFLNEEADFVLVFSKLETLSSDLSVNFASLDASTTETEILRIEDYIKCTLSGIRSQTRSPILWHGFELPIYPALGILDSQSSTGQSAMINSLNEVLRSSLKNHDNAYFVDLNLCQGRIGFDRFYDHRFWHIGRAPYTREALREIATEDFKFIRAFKGKSKKCLALDCDNILWGGIIGEDGITGINLGQTYPGSAYYELQQEVLNLYKRGVILALCSRNNENDVWEVFKKHPHMILKEEHIAAAQINWCDKASNLERIAADLNIGLESIVFIDDTEFETNLIRENLPEVEVIYMPQSKAVEYRQILASCGLFDTLTLSDEDKNRTTMYKAEAQRRKLKGLTTDLTTYFRSLKMEIDMSFADEFSIPRIAQLTQKTNQFNLTTKRYSEADIKALALSNLSDVVYLKLKDRFGDSGIVGVCVLRYEDKKSILDTFLLSCRVLGRGIEDIFLTQVLKLAVKRGSKEAIGQYCVTSKNSQVRYFYSERGFQKVDDNQGNRTSLFKYMLNAKPRFKNELLYKIKSEI